MIYARVCVKERQSVCVYAHICSSIVSLSVNSTKFTRVRVRVSVYTHVCTYIYDSARNGDRYEGEWQADRKHGFGRLVYAEPRRGEHRDTSAHNRNGHAILAAGSLSQLRSCYLLYQPKCAAAGFRVRWRMRQSPPYQEAKLEHKPTLISSFLRGKLGDFGKNRSLSRSIQRHQA